jgi:hypothetical protein
VEHKVLIFAFALFDLFEIKPTSATGTEQASTTSAAAPKVEGEIEYQSSLK